MGISIVQSPFSLHKFNQQTKALWNSLYLNREIQLGATATLVNFGDEKNAGLASATTFTGAKFHSTGLAPVWTPAEKLSLWDTPLSLGNKQSWQGNIPVLKFNGTDERMTSPDAAYWSTTLDAFSIGAWVKMVDATSSVIMAKYTVAGDLREWVFQLDSADKLQLIIYDEDDASTPNASLDSLADVALAESAWAFVVATYDGSADASGIDLYVDGVVVASTDTDDANFTSGRDTTAVVELGRGNATNYFDGSMAGGACGPFFVKAALTAEQIYNMYRLERLALGV